MRLLQLLFFVSSTKLTAIPPPTAEILQMAKKAEKPSRSKPKEDGAGEKRVYFRQSDFPLHTLQQAQRIATALVDDFAGRNASPPDVAMAMSLSPTSSFWRDLTGSAIACGLTDGGVNADTMSLTQLGRKLVEPTAEGDDLKARREAVMKPRIAKEFFERYRRAKFPQDAIGINVLKALGIPPDRATAALENIKANGRYAGIIRETPTGLFVSLDAPGIPAPTATPVLPTDSDETGEDQTGGGENDNSSPPDPAALKATTSPPPPAFDPKINRVFISHGKKKEIVAQIKELLAFGNFDPIVSVERESTAIPVPEKVFEDMRSCGAGVIHVGAEGKFLDRDAKSTRRLTTMF